MRVERIGKRQYAFGMTWTDSGSSRPKNKDVKAQRKMLDPVGRARYYYCTLGTKGRYSLGGGIVATRVRGPVYSYAGALAATRPDGIYVAPVDDSKLWFCVIRDGVVTPETDVVDDANKVLTSIEGYRSLLNIDASNVFATEGIQIRGGAELFDPVEAVAHVRKPVALRALGSKVAIGPLVFATGVVVAGVVGYRAYQVHKAESENRIVTEQQRQQAIQNYQSTARAALAAYPKDADWTSGAWRALAGRMPIFLAGWQIKSITCTLSGCDTSYARSGNTPNAVTPFTNLFGQQSVMIDSTGESLKVHLPLANQSVQVDDALLHNPPPAGMSLLDWLGLVPVHIAGMVGRPTVSATNLAAGGGAQVGYPDFMVETVTLKGRSSLQNTLQSATNWGGAGAFRITKLDASFGNGSDSSMPNWAITLVRIHR